VVERGPVAGPVAGTVAGTREEADACALKGEEKSSGKEELPRGEVGGYRERDTFTSGAME
jgi:hypothetical protein